MLPVALLAATACDAGWSACESVFDAQACGASFEVEPGPWTATATAWSDSCADDAWPGSDWVVSEEGGELAVAIEASAAAACDRAGGTYTCEGVDVDGVTVSHDGDFTSQSEALGTVRLVSDTCTADADLTLLAEWRYAIANPEGATTGFFQNIFGGAGYAPGTCPPGDDWTWLDRWDECDDQALQAPVTIHNDSDQDIGLYQMGVFYSTIGAGTTYGPVDYCQGWIMALSNGSDTAGCLTTFRVAEGGTEVSWPDED